MAQKVITIAANAYVISDSKSIDFPTVTAALREGYTVKDFKQIMYPAANDSSNIVITFILEKND